MSFLLRLVGIVCTIAPLAMVSRADALEPPSTPSTQAARVLGPPTFQLRAGADARTRVDVQSLPPSPELRSARVVGPEGVPSDSCFSFSIDDGGVWVKTGGTEPLLPGTYATELFVAGRGGPSTSSEYTRLSFSLVKPTPALKLSPAAFSCVGIWNCDLEPSRIAVRDTSKSGLGASHLQLSADNIIGPDGALSTFQVSFHPPKTIAPHSSEDVPVAAQNTDSLRYGKTTGLIRARYDGLDETASQLTIERRMPKWCLAACILFGIIGGALVRRALHRLALRRQFLDYCERLRIAIAPAPSDLAETIKGYIRAEEQALRGPYGELFGPVDLRNLAAKVQDKALEEQREREPHRAKLVKASQYAAFPTDYLLPKEIQKGVIALQEATSNALRRSTTFTRFALEVEAKKHTSEVTELRKQCKTWCEAICEVERSARWWEPHTGYESTPQSASPDGELADAASATRYFLALSAAIPDVAKKVAARILADAPEESKVRIQPHLAVLARHRLADPESAKSLRDSLDGLLAELHSAALVVASAEVAERFTPDYSASAAMAAYVKLKGKPETLSGVAPNPTTATSVASSDGSAAEEAVHIPVPGPVPPPVGRAPEQILELLASETGGSIGSRWLLAIIYLGILPAMFATCFATLERGFVGTWPELVVALASGLATTGAVSFVASRAATVGTDASATEPVRREAP